jgi:hypothetical protein
MIGYFITVVKKVQYFLTSSEGKISQNKKISPDDFLVHYELRCNSRSPPPHSLFLTKIGQDSALRQENTVLY